MQRFLGISPIDHQTKYKNEKIENLLKMQKIANSMDKDECDIELVLRSFKGIFGMDGDVTREQAIKICLTQIEINPSHNFFAFALAMHHETDIKKKQTYLQTAASSLYPLGEKISRQAAYELAKSFFASKEYIKSQAWLTRAIILGNEDAINSYCYTGMSGEIPVFLNSKEINQAISCRTENDIKNNLKPSAHLPTLLYASFLAITLSNIKLNYIFFEKRYQYFEDNYWSNAPIGLYEKKDALFEVNSTRNLFPALMLYRDSSLGKLACRATEGSPFIFYEFFLYCAKNKIISVEVDNAVMNFLSNYPPHQYALIAIESFNYLYQNSKLMDNKNIFVYSSDRVVFVNSIKNPIIELQMSDIKHFHQRMQPTKKERILTAQELNEIMSMTSFTPPYDDVEKIISTARARLGYLSIESQTNYSWSATATHEPVYGFGIEPNYSAPQMSCHYVPPPIIDDNQAASFSIQNTQDFARQFPSIPRGALQKQSVFSHQPVNQQLQSSQQQTRKLDEATRLNL